VSSAPPRTPASVEDQAAPSEGHGEGPEGTEGRASAWSLVRLGVVVAAIVALFVGFGQSALLVVIVAVVLMVMIHELGHFATAKWSHMKVTEYFLGFGPRLWSIKRGETEYGIKAIPAGGYGRIPGMTNLEEVDPADEPRTYRQQPFHNRLAVALAGSFMHFVMAFVLAWAALVFIGAPSRHGVVIQGFVAWQGHQHNAAQQGGLKVGDEVVAINGRPVTNGNQLADAVAASPGTPVHLRVVSGGTTRSLTVVPANSADIKGEQPSAAKGHKAVGEIGVMTTPPTVAQNPLSALGGAGETLGRVTTSAVAGLGQVFSPHGVSSYVSQVSNPSVATKDARNGTPRIESIVGAVRTATQGAQAGTLYLFEVLIALNIFIGLVNLLPMLPLDGGHVAIALYERVRSRKGRPYHADAAKLMPVAYVVVTLLVVLFTTSLYLDLAHPVANPFHG
jgi:membrane-associated protease RseP (regulator of RpoE activity)